MGLPGLKSGVGKTVVLSGGSRANPSSCLCQFPHPSTHGQISPSSKPAIAGQGFVARPSLWLSLFLLRGRSGFDGPLSNSGQSAYPRTSTLNSLCISAPSPCVTGCLHGLRASGRGHLGRVLVWLLSLLFIDSFIIGSVSTMRLEGPGVGQGLVCLAHPCVCGSQKNA